MPGPTRALAEILARPVAPDARRRAALHLLDWIGCAVLGATTPTGRIFVGWAKAAGTTGPAHAIGVGRVAAEIAATANGAHGNLLEMDDVHRTAILHPGPTVIPAALAAAERADASGAALLDAIVRGYEAVIRVGRSLGAAHYARWHTTSTAGPFGAAAAVASIAGSSGEVLVAALGLAGTQSAGPWQMRLEGGGAKQLHNARAAQAGLVAADLAAAGLTGPVHILEGPLGLYAATGAVDADPSSVGRDPASAWLIFDTSVKPWPACRHAHATIDAALALRPRIVDLARVTAIQVASYKDALTFCDRVQPTSVIQAKFSLQHAVASVLAKGAPTLQDFEPAAFGDPVLAALRDKIAVTAAEPFVSAFPERYGARVRAQLDDGTVLEATVPDALGDPANPLAESGWIEKAEQLLAASGMDAAQIARLVAATRALAEGGSLAAMTRELP